MQDRYRVVTGPPFSPPNVRAEELKGLAVALNALQHPVVTALDDVSVDMVELAFNSLLPKDRQELLRTLSIRIAAPRRAGRSLCRDVLTRLQREARQHSYSCGAKGLTVTVMDHVGGLVFPHTSETATDPVSRWGAELVRATVFAWSNASVADAYVLAWAADQDWFADTADENQAIRLAAVGDAARSIVAAYPGFVPAVAQKPEPPLETGSNDVSEAAVKDARTDLGAELTAVCREVESALAQARNGVERVADAVADGCPPQHEDLAPAIALAAEFDRAEAVFRAAGVGGVHRRLEDMTRAAGAYRAAHEHDIRTRATLRELLDVACRQDSAAAAAEAVRDAARLLLDAPMWEQEHRDESAALVALARLIRLGRQADDAAEILALQEQVWRVLPACAPAAAMARELTLAQQDAAAREPVRTEADGTDSVHCTKVGRQRTEQSTAQEDGTAQDETPGRPASETPTRPAPEPGTVTPVMASAHSIDTGNSSQAATSINCKQAPSTVPEAQPAPGPSSADTLTLAGPRDEHVPAPVTIPAPAMPGEVDEAGEDESAYVTVAERALARLVVERRFGLAHHVARAAGHPEPQVAALRLAGAAAMLTPGDSQGARLTADLLQSDGGSVGRDAEGSELLLLPALLRTALITGDHLAGAQLKALAPRLPDCLGQAATAVADRALSGALMIASPLVANDSETEARRRELREQSKVLLVPPRLRFARATQIAKLWLTPEDGMLGSLLLAVVRDNRDAVPRVREQAERLSKLAEVNNEIDRIDRKLRSSSGKPLQGQGRQDLVHLVERAVRLVKEWCLSADGARRGDRSDGNRAVKEISFVRQSLLDGKEAALSELEQLARRSGVLAAATAWAALASMQELFALLTGDTTTMRPTGSLAPEVVLDAELLKVCDTQDEQPSLDELLTAVDRSWQDGFAERLANDAFNAVRTIVELAESGLLPAEPPAEFTFPTFSEIEEKGTTRRTQLREEHDELVAELHRAQADGAVTDDQDLRLQELLVDARERLDGTETHALVEVRRALATVRTDLPAFRQQADDRIRARLDALDPIPENRAHVLRHLDTGGLATAADLVYFLEIGEPVPEIETGESHLTEFFPAVPDGLPRGIDCDLVNLVRSGGRHPTIPILDYGDLSPDEAALAADNLDEWRALGAIEPKDRLQVAPTRQVPPLLKLLGYEAESARSLDERSPHLRRREYRLFEATKVEVNGRAKVPAFGSEIKEQGGNLRVLMVWGRPPAKVVMSWAERDNSGASLLVIYFGTMSREARVELAVGSGRLAQPLLVVDDAALAYLAARGNRQVSTATQTLLPFSGVNPYIREKRGRIGGEMFYGRDAERKSILDPRGSQVIFGGRGLGKSALLADAGDRFVERRPGYHLAVHVNLDHENIGKGSSFGPEALWNVLDRKLTEAQVLGPPPGRRSVTDVSERVREGIHAWTAEDSRRGLLILLDECDQFFEADAPRFNQTKKLKGLGDDTKDRTKVVFAGLHSVQRFAKLASNGPFGHLAQTPKVIGPLAPQSAADLLVEPMRALGFEFRDMDLVNRVLGYCSYQPFLLQMFGHRLVERMHHRARRGVESPPYSVELADIEVVESDAELRDGISAAFKDTLSLDHRYDVIANVLAYHARHRGLEVRLSDTELREECETYWRRGFEQLDTEGFRAYLSEMVGLGILAPNHDGLGWHLRGPNALRMIGTSHEVEARLLRAEDDCELQESIVQDGRPELPDGRPAPLTNTQLDDLLGRRSNQVRVVLGTRATGVCDVAHTLRTLTAGISGWSLPPVGNPSAYKQELAGGRPGERRVVISDFVNYRGSVAPETCRDAADLAETLLPRTPGVSRAVILVIDTRQLALWRPLLTGTELTSAAPVVLRRHDRRSLRGWAQRVDMFQREDRLERLHELTGGWPHLVSSAHDLHRELEDPDEALRRLAELRTDPARARAFAQHTGLYADPLLATAYRHLEKEYKDGPFDWESALTAVAIGSNIGEDEARWIITCLNALQVFDGEGSQLSLEPLLRECLTAHG